MKYLTVLIILMMANTPLLAASSHPCDGKISNKMAGDFLLYQMKTVNKYILNLKNNNYEPLPDYRYNGKCKGDITDGMINDYLTHSRDSSELVKNGLIYIEAKIESDKATKAIKAKNAKEKASLAWNKKYGKNPNYQWVYEGRNVVISKGHIKEIKRQMKNGFWENICYRKYGERICQFHK